MTRTFPKSLRGKLVLALTAQSTSNSFDGTPAAKAALRKLPDGLAAAGVNAITARILRWYGDKQWVRDFVKSSRQHVSAESSERIDDCLALSYGKFVEKYAPDYA